VRPKLEANLPHQLKAVRSVAEVFRGLEATLPSERWLALRVNPKLGVGSATYRENLKRIAGENGIPVSPTFSEVIDVLMETGTGKTYTYARTMFELNRLYGLWKFVVVVPTLPIKAGTANFFTSPQTIHHFKDLYGKTLELFVVESRKGNREELPTPVVNFVNAQNDGSSIKVLLINAGMVNSETMARTYDRLLLDRYATPFEGIAAVNPVLIVDEPHRFPQKGKTWSNLQKFRPQFVLRFGATFEDNRYENLVYALTSVEAFNQNLVKGVIGFVEEIPGKEREVVRLVGSDGREATFELITAGGKRKKLKLRRGESLERLHPEMKDLFVEKLNRSEVLLSNGLIVKRGEKLYPYAFSVTLEEKMVEEAVRRHFEIERELVEERGLAGLPRIKPITLFFIDNIEEYRSPSGKVRQVLEEAIKKYARKALAEAKDPFYREYLEKTLSQVSKTHGGYFSRDNREKDQEIEEEINKILHEREKLLDFKEPMRFVFSKWTLREGWDNPNVFQICKLRSSGSETSKLQEVGRGLRLPVNEKTERERGEFYLHYFVDFTEADFVEKLVGEINDRSRLFQPSPERLTPQLRNAIAREYGLDPKELLKELAQEGIVDLLDDYRFLEGGFEKLKRRYPKAFKKYFLEERKVRRGDEKLREKARARTEKFPPLREPWERLNSPHLLTYDLTEEEFKELFKSFLRERGEALKKSSVLLTEKRTVKKGREVGVEERALRKEVYELRTTTYGEFVRELSRELKVRADTLHRAFRELLAEGTFNANDYLNYETVRTLKQGFNDYLLEKAEEAYSVDFLPVRAPVHPTKLTDGKGNPLREVPGSSLGTEKSPEPPAENFYFEDLFYDSQPEKENAQTGIKEVEVFTKIPKGSALVPLPGGRSYSPDFLLVLKNGKYLVVETKGKARDDLSKREEKRLELARKLLTGKLGVELRVQHQGVGLKEIVEKVLKPPAEGEQKDQSSLRKR